MLHLKTYTCRNRACSNFRAELSSSLPCGRCGWVTRLAAIFTWRPGA